MTSWASVMENEGIVLNAYVKKMPSFISTYDEDNVSHESSEVGAPSTDLVQGDRETKVCVPESVLELHNHRLENKDNVERDRKTTAVDILRRNFGRSRSRRNFSFTEDYRDPEDVVVSISNMQMGHSETSVEHPKNNGQVEVILECQSKSEFSDEEGVEFRTNDSGETFECKVEPIEEGGSREMKQHVYCSVYCIANDSYRNSVDNTGGEEDHRTVTPSISNTSLEQNTQSLQLSGSELRGYPEPFTLADLVDATTLNNFYYGESSLSVLTCRICLEDKQIKPLLCCKRAVCEECLDTYISSQVRVGRVAITCPIPECSGYLEEGVVVATLAFEDVAKYKYFLELSRLDAGTKPCPQCNLFTSLKTHSGEPTPIRIENKYKIQCSECQFVWCFRCHAPWHDGLKCRDYRKGDKLLRDWASVIEHGQRNAQKCPRCKIHIQRTEGCDHMTCTQCNTNFCYRCGERYRHLRFFGDHTSDLSVFGCKYRYLPDKPHLRRFVRGSVCVTKLLLCPLVVVLTVVVGAVVIVVALLIFPIYCCKKRKKRPQGVTGYEYWLS